MFNLVGRNCSTRAWQAFEHAGIVSTSMPGLDTPDNLYRQLKHFRKNTTSYSGYIGFLKENCPERTFQLLIQETNTPKKRNERGPNV